MILIFRFIMIYSILKDVTSKIDVVNVNSTSEGEKYSVRFFYNTYNECINMIKSFQSGDLSKSDIFPCVFFIFPIKEVESETYHNSVNIAKFLIIDGSDSSDEQSLNLLKDGFFEQLSYDKRVVGTNKFFNCENLYIPSEIQKTGFNVNILEVTNLKLSLNKKTQTC